MLAALRVKQATLAWQPDEEVRKFGEPFELDPGMGWASYLLADGRVILDERAFFGTLVREATVNEAIGSLVVGAKKTGISALLDLLPPRPADAITCQR